MQSLSVRKKEVTPPNETEKRLMQQLRRSLSAPPFEMLNYNSVRFNMIQMFGSERYKELSSMVLEEFLTSPGGKNGL